MYEPKLRFPGYTESLKRISCGELFQERKEKGQDHLPILTLSIHTGISDHELDDEESIKKVKRSEDKSLYKRVYPNDLAFNMMRAWQGAFGVSKVEGMISPAYIVAEPIKEINADYLNYYIQTARFIGAANNLSYGVTDFRKRLYWNSFCKIELHLPSLEEQNKIAALLVSIDNTIDKQKEMISAWEERKKGVMQKLFNQEVRFKEDDGSNFPEWEKKSFSDVFENLNNSTFSRDCLNYKAGDAKYIHYGDVLVKFGFVVDVQSLNVPYVNKDLNCEKYSLLSDGDIVIADTAEDDAVGKAVEIMNVHDRKIISGLHTIACHPKEKFASKYLGYFMNADVYHNQLRPYMQGIKVTSISKTNIALTKILIPCLTEQQKIADCLSALDKVIEKQKARLTAWEKLKKGLLQQMFV